MRNRDISFNLLSNITLQILVMISGFILPRFYLANFGSSVNGLLSSIKQFIGYLALVEAGLGLSVITALYNPLSKNDYSKVNKILSAARIFYLRSGVIFSALIFILGLIYPLIIKNSPINYMNILLLVIIIGATAASEFFLISKYKILLIADQKNYVISNIQSIGTIINLAVSIVLIRIKFDIVVIQLFSSLIYISRFVFIFVYAKRKYPYISFNETPDLNALDKRWDAFVHQVTSIVVFNSPIVLLSIFQNLIVVSVFSIYNMIFMAINQLVLAFSNGLMSGFGVLIASNNSKKLLKVFDSFEYIYFMIITWGYTCTALFIIPFVKLYTKGVQDANYILPTLALMFILVGVSNNIRVPSNTIISAAGHFKQTKYRAVLEAILNISFSLIFVFLYGIYGVLIGSVISFMYRTIDTIVYADKHILGKTTIGRTVQRITRDSILAIITYILISSYIDIESIISLKSFTINAIFTSAISFIIIISGNLLFEYKHSVSIVVSIYKLLRKKIIKSYRV